MALSGNEISVASPHGTIKQPYASFAGKEAAAAPVVTPFEGLRRHVGRLMHMISWLAILGLPHV